MIPLQTAFVIPHLILVILLLRLRKIKLIL